MRIDEQGRHIISQTEMATFLRCENRHKYSYGLHLDLPPSGGTAAMQFGTACHYAFQHGYEANEENSWISAAWTALLQLRDSGYYYYKGVKQPLDKLTQADWERIQSVVQGYYDNMLRTVEYDDLGSKYEYAAEVTSITHIIGNLYLEHTFDLVQMNVEGGPPTIMDHKFRARVSTDELIHLAPQNMMYSWAAWKMYGEVCNMVVNTVQSKPPAFKPGKKAVGDYYRRDEFFHSEAQLETFQEIIADAAYQIDTREIMLKTLGNRQARRTMIANGSDSCLWCPYKLVCEQELDGVMSNTDLVLALGGEAIQESDID